MQRKTFSQELHEVKDEILLLSSMLEQAVIDSVTALKDNDLAQARRILSNDIFINRKRFETETSIIVLIYSMAEKAVDMLHRAMTTFADEDIGTAADIMQEDDIIDECYSRLYQDAVQSVLQDARNIERANYVIWTAHNLERLGDRVTNICERVIYVVRAERPQWKAVPKDSKLSVREYEC